MFSVNFPEGEFDTIGGLLIHEFGRMPKRGEVVTIDGFRFKVLRADSRRIYLLQITLVGDDKSDGVKAGVA
jgi:magnesium and cobalt transporter